MVADLRRATEFLAGEGDLSCAWLDGEGKNLPSPAGASMARLTLRVGQRSHSIRVAVEDLKPLAEHLPSWMTDEARA